MFSSLFNKLEKCKNFSFANTEMKIPHYMRKGEMIERQQLPLVGMDKGSLCQLETVTEQVQTPLQLKVSHYISSLCPEKYLRSTCALSRSSSREAFCEMICSRLAFFWSDKVCGQISRVAAIFPQSTHSC